jgi:hypothetical protein
MQAPNTLSSLPLSSTQGDVLILAYPLTYEEGVSLISLRSRVPHTEYETHKGQRSTECPPKKSGTEFSDSRRTPPQTRRPLRGLRQAVS